MNILVTAGNTLALIDKVRCITNVFTGRTGAGIALEAYARGHTVTLLTSHPEVVAELSEGKTSPGLDRFDLLPYRTFEDLRDRMAERIPAPGLDAVVHCAAVSDYLSAGVYAAAEGSAFDPGTGRWSGPAPALAARGTEKKIKSDEDELWVRLVKAPKLVDRIRKEWGFRGVLVKFKLEVGLRDEELLDIAEASRRQSDADYMVANTLEGAPFYALLGPLAEGVGYERISRGDLAGRLLAAMEDLHQRRQMAGADQGQRSP